MRQALTISNKTSELSRLKSWITELTKTHQIPEEPSHALILAMDEMVANIISYAYDDNEIHDIDIEIKFFKKSLQLTIIDSGRQFNPLHTPDPDTQSPLEERPVGGMGIYLAKNMMDDIQYNYVANKNHLVMYKDL